MELPQHWVAEPPTMSGTTTRPPRAPDQGPESGWQNTPGTDSSLFLSPILLSPVIQESVSTDEEHLSSTVYNHLAESLAYTPSQKPWRDQVWPGESRWVQLPKPRRGEAGGRGKEGKQAAVLAPVELLISSNALQGTQDATRQKSSAAEGEKKHTRRADRETAPYSRQSCV